MTVPDILLTVSGIGILFSMLPGIVENFREQKGYNFTTCTLVASMLVLIVIAFVMLGTVFAAIVTGIQISLWVVLAAQAKFWNTARPTVCEHGKVMCACRNKR